MQVVTGSRYLGGSISDQESEKAWLLEKVEVWKDMVDVLSGVALRHPQTAYVVMKKSLHQVWDLVQRATLHIGEVFHLVVEALDKYFLPALFKGSTTEVTSRGITRLAVKQVGLAIPRPTLPTWDN